MYRSRISANLLSVMKEEAAQIAQREDMLLVIEPLNTYVNHPGYFLETSVGFEIVQG